MKTKTVQLFFFQLNRLLLRAFFVTLVSSLSFGSNGSDATTSPGITEKLSSKIALDAVLNDENNNPITLKSIIDKPTIVLFVYYECPALCNPLIVEVASQIDRINLTPAKDYQLVCISFDDKENAEIAKRKRHDILNSIQKQFPHDGWRFLTGNHENIMKVTKSAGFSFRKEGTQIAHASAIILVSPKGEITRYLMGTTFLPFDIKMAIIEASEGKVSPTISKLLKFCFNYDPQGRKYVLNITRIAGGGILLLALVLVIVSSIKPRKSLKS